MSRLRERIDEELEQIDQNLRHLHGSDELPDKSEFEVAGVAALINSFYNGVENILKQVLLARSLPLPAGEAWHMALLAAAKDQAIMTVPLFEKLKTYMAFRRFFSHAYVLDLDPARFEPLVRDLPDVIDQLKKAHHRPSTDPYAHL